MENKTKKNNYKYDGHSNPNWIWKDKEYPSDLSFEEKLQLFLKESRERCKGIKTEFINNTQANKLALKKAKKRASIKKRG